MKNLIIKKYARWSEFNFSNMEATSTIPNITTAMIEITIGTIFCINLAILYFLI
jgi:hypothetical protein